MSKSVVFPLGNILFGVTTDQVGGLYKVRKIEPVPGAPEWIGGLVTYRDRTLPYIKFWKILELETPPKEILLIPYEFGYCAFGIPNVQGIFEIEMKEKDSKVLPLPYIMGFGELEGKIVIGIELKGLLTPSQKHMIKDLNKKNEKT
ncbi:MAG: chemotaxis protein CheW [candidate division WOR-3 bacterium]|nr:chemotaxis protein CheW [candidate division WOR-3 bacterium]